VLGAWIVLIFGVLDHSLVMRGHGKPPEKLRGKMEACDVGVERIVSQA